MITLFNAPGGWLRRDRSRAGRPLGRFLGKRSLALALAASLLLPSSAATLLLPAPAQAQATSTASDLASIKIPTVPAEQGRIRTILMFPFAPKVDTGAAEGFDVSEVGARVEDAIKTRLNTIGRYKGDSFSPTLPQIQRAITDSGINNDLTETDVAPPYDTPSKGLKLADEIATDGYLLGTIEGIQTDAKTGTVSLTITATLYSTETGRAVKALAYTGRGISFSASDNPQTLLQSAINDAAGHVVSSLNADVAQAPVKPDVRRAHHSGVGAVALGILVAAAIAIGITASHNSHHNSGGSSTTTTTTPVTTNPVTGGGPPSPPSL